MMVVVEVELSTRASYPEEGGPVGWEEHFPSLVGSLAFHL